MKSSTPNPARRTRSRWSRRLTTLAASLLLAGAAQAQATRLTFDQPAEPLGKALATLARTAGVQVVFASALTEGKAAPALKGSYTAREALDALLAGSGLVLRVQDDKTFTVERAPAPAPAPKPTETVLPEIKVRAAAPVETATSPVVGYLARRSATGTKTDALVADIPQSIVVIPGDLLRDRGVAKVSEAVDTVAGVVRGGTYGGNTSSADFIARGFEALKLRDGMRLNAQGFGDALDIGSIERVEVLKGPAAVLYGAGEPGGTVNLVSKKPYAGFGGEAGLSYDSFGTGRLSVDLNAPFTADDTLLFRINAAVESGDTYRDFVKRDNSLIAPTLEWRPHAGTKLTLQYERVHTKGLFDRGLGRSYNYEGTGIDYNALPVERFIGEPSVGPSRTTTSQAIATLEQDLGGGWRAKLAYADNRFDYDNQPEVGLDTFDPATGLFSRYFIDYATQGERTRTALAEVSGKLVLGGIGHQMLIGADATRNKAYYVALQGIPAPGPINVTQPQYTGYAGYSTDFYYSGLQGSNGHSFYAQDLLTFSPQWKALLALRHDRASRFSGAFPGQPDDSGVVNRNAFSKTSPRAGLVYQPSAVDSFYGSWSTSFSPAVFINLRDPSAFKPESGKQLEVGWKRDWAEGRLSSTLAVFDIRKQNVAVSDPTNSADEYFEVQVGEYRSRGIELDVNGSPWPGLRLSLGLGYADVAVSKSSDPALPVGSRQIDTPRVTAKLWVSQDLGAGWSVGAGLFHASATPTSGLTFPAYTRLDASLAWQQGAWQVQLSGKNLSNVKYHAGNLPQAPRHAVLGASYKF